MKNRKIAIVLAIFGGVIGAHRFYLGQTLRGILNIPMGLYAGPVTGLIWLLTSTEQFDNKYNKQAIQKASLETQNQILKTLQAK